MPSIRVTTCRSEDSTMLSVEPVLSPGDSKVNLFVDFSPSMDGKRIYIVKRVLSELLKILKENIVLYGFCRDVWRIYSHDSGSESDPGEALISQKICYATNPKPLLEEIAKSPIYSNIIISDGEFNKPLHKFLPKTLGNELSKDVYFILLFPKNDIIEYFDGLKHRYGFDYIVAREGSAGRALLRALVAYGALGSAPISVEVEESPYYEARPSRVSLLRESTGSAYYGGLFASGRIVIRRIAEYSEPVSAVLAVRELSSPRRGAVEERASKLAVPV